MQRAGRWQFTVELGLVHLVLGSDDFFGALILSLLDTQACLLKKTFLPRLTVLVY